MVLQRTGPRPTIRPSVGSPQVGAQGRRAAEQAADHTDHLPRLQQSLPADSPTRTGVIGRLGRLFRGNDKPVAAVLVAATALPAVSGAAIAAQATADPNAVDDEPADTADAHAILFDGAVRVWAFESHIGGPGDFQPIAGAHFDRDDKGRITGLVGPRINVTMPAEIGVKVDALTLTATDSIKSPLPTEVRPGADGRFGFDPDSPLTGATTAFYAAARVIDGADRWAGHKVEWGEDGTLTVVPYRFVTDFFNAYYDAKGKTLNLGALGSINSDSGKLFGLTGQPEGWPKPVDNLLLDAARSPDIIAHESGHAVLNALKPGTVYGMSIAFSESFADIVTFLSALEDPDVVDRVLAETGGDLRKPSEITRIAETIGDAQKRLSNDDPSDDADGHLRSPLDVLTFDDVGLGRADTDIMGMGFSPNRNPHRVGEILTGAVYEVLAGVYDSAVAAGQTPKAALTTARDVTGKLITRATRHVGEHGISLRGVGLAMVRVDADLFGGANHGAIVKGLQSRKLIDVGEDVDSLVAADKARMPAFVMPTDATEPADILARIEAFESKQVEKALADESTPQVMLRHNVFIPSYEVVAADQLAVHSDTTADDGVRVIRLHYKTSDPDPRSASQPGGAGKVDAYFSLVFGADGTLIDLQNDRPSVATY